LICIIFLKIGSIGNLVSAGRAVALAGRWLAAVLLLCAGLGIVWLGAANVIRARLQFG
jgi:hypothetical protein